MDLQWTKNKKPFGKGRNIEVTKRSSKDQLRTIVYFRSARESDAGEYWCKVNGVDVIRKKINIYVVSSISKMCERESFKSNRRHLLWPITFAGSTQTIPCPTYGNDDKREIVISRTCTSNGIWGDVDFGNCSWIPLSQKLTKLLNVRRVYNIQRHDTAVHDEIPQGRTGQVNVGALRVIWEA